MDLLPATLPQAAVDEMRENMVLRARSLARKGKPTLARNLYMMAHPGMNVRQAREAVEAFIAQDDITQVQPGDQVSCEGWNFRVIHNDTTGYRVWLRSHRGSDCLVTHQRLRDAYKRA